MPRTTTTRTATTGGTLEAMAAAAVADFEHVLARLSQSEATRLRQRFESFTLHPNRSGPQTIASVARGLTREARRLLAQEPHNVVVSQAGGMHTIAANVRDAELRALMDRPSSMGVDEDDQQTAAEPPRRARRARVRQGNVDADLPVDDAYRWRDDASLRARYGSNLATFAQARGVTARRVQRCATSRTKHKPKAAEKPEPVRKPMRPAARVEREPPMTADERATHDAALWTERIVGRWQGNAALRESFGGRFDLYLVHIEAEADGTLQPLSQGFDARAAVAALGGSLAGIEEPMTPEQEAEAYQSGITRARRDDRWERDPDLRATFGGRRELWDLEQDYLAQREPSTARRHVTNA